MDEKSDQSKSPEVALEYAYNELQRKTQRLQNQVHFVREILELNPDNIYAITSAIEGLEGHILSLNMLLDAMKANIDEYKSASDDES